MDAKVVALVGLLIGCGNKASEQEPPLLRSAPMSEQKPAIAASPTAGSDGPALALTEDGVLYRVGATVEEVAKNVRCLGAAGAAGKVVTDTGILSVTLDTTKPEGPAIDGLTLCGIGHDGAVLAITASGVVRIDAGGATALGALPPQAEAPVGITSDRTGAIWVIDAKNIHQLAGGRWRTIYVQAAVPSGDPRALEPLADGSFAAISARNSFFIVANGTVDEVYLYGGLRSIVPAAIGSGADGAVWGGDYKYVVRVNGADSRDWERVNIGFHGGAPTAVTGDGRGRGWLANDLVLAVMSDDGKLIAEVGLDAFADKTIKRIVVAGAGPAEVKAREVKPFTGTVRGVVLVRDEIVPGAKVRLCVREGDDLMDPCAGAKKVFEAVADDDGRFTLDGVPPLDMSFIVEAGDVAAVPMSAKCCGGMKRGEPYQIRFDLGDSVGGDGMAVCPKKTLGYQEPCKIPGVDSRPPKKPF